TTGLAAREQRLEGLQVGIGRAQRAYESRHVEVAMSADQHQHGMKRVEVLSETRLDAGNGFGMGARAKQATCEAMELFRDRIVTPGHLDQLGELAFQRGVLFAQDLDLALDQRYGRSTPDVGQTQARQQRLVSLEEFRMVLQISRDRFFFGLGGRQATGFACCHKLQTSTCPSNAISAGPVNQICSPGPPQFTRNSPPRTRTLTSESRRPL